MSDFKFLKYNKETGTIEGFYAEDVNKVIPYDCCIKISNGVWSSLLEQGVDKYLVNTSIQINDQVYTDINDFLMEDTLVKIIVSSTRIDEDKLAMAEAIADLYERILVLEGRV